MAELINSNVFDVNKKFVDFAGLDYFWEKAKGYIDGVDTSIAGRVTANEGAISGIQGQLESLTTGGAGSIQSQISAAIEALDLANTYDSKGAADQALVDAKKYVDDMKISDAIATAKSEATTYADGLNTAMDTRVKVLEAIDHEKLASDASAAAVATVLDGAPEKFDTLKEIAEWIGSKEDAETAADLVTRVKALEDVDADNRLDVLEGRDVYVAQDVTDAIATAKSEAIADAASDAASKLAEAKSYADGKDTAMDTRVKVLEAIDHDAYKAADTALETSLKGYVDGKDTAMDTRVKVLEAIDHNAYKAADNALETSLKSYADTAEADAVAAAVAQAKLDAAEALKSYYTKTEVDGLLSTNSQADQLYAKTYTDELFNSIKFAQNSDIDGLFNVQVPA